MNTRRMFWALVAVASVLSCAPVYYPDTGPTRLMIEQKSHAVTVEKTCLNVEVMAKTRSHGSGVLYNNNTVITANHVTAEHPSKCVLPIFKVVTADGTSYGVTDIRPVPGVDVSFVTLSTHVPFISPVSFAAVVPGDKVCLEARAPRAGRACGSVEVVYSDNFVHDAWVDRGNSGSGVYNTDGRLVGIVSTCKWDGIVRECTGGGSAVALWGIEERFEE